MITVSTGCAAGEREDRSGKLAVEGLTDLGLQVTGHEIMADDRLRIAQSVIRACDFDPVALLFLTGGTGPTPDDVTPEAILGLLQRRFEGIEAAIHEAGRRQVTTAPLSRAVVGQRGCTIVIAVPGSPGAVNDAIATLTPLLPHLLSLVHGDQKGHRQPSP
ncbi:MAG: MogA/MoaB family molybdenum cofactor biosynthesis protein [Candidatus Zixiibacteriota bacterium]